MTTYEEWLRQNPEEGEVERYIYRFSTYQCLRCKDKYFDYEQQLEEHLFEHECWDEFEEFSNYFGE